MNNDISARYKQAESIVQGLLSKQLVLNDAVFPHWIGDSDCFWYQRETNQGKEFRLVDAKAASNQPAFNHQALGEALTRACGKKINAFDLPINSISFTSPAQQISFRAFGKDWEFNIGNNVCHETVGPQVEGLYSPDGKKRAFVRDYNLWIRDIEAEAEYALTEDGTLDYAYAIAAALTGAPSTPAVQAVWSPDSKHLLTYQLDVRQVAPSPTVHHVPHDGSVRPQCTEHKVAFAGDKQVEQYRLLFIDLETRKSHIVDHEPIPVSRFGAGYFSDEKFGWWANDCQRFFFVDISRGAKAIRVVETNIGTGASHTVLEETSDTFVKLSHGILDHPLFLPLPDSDELIWFSERSGWGHLYLYDLTTGKVKNPITEGNWLVREILHVDTKRRELLIQTAGRDPAINPYYRDICCVNLDSGELSTLISGVYDHVVFGPGNLQTKIREAFNQDGGCVNSTSNSGNYVICTRSRVDELPVSLIIDRGGREVLTLEKAESVGLPTDWHWPEPITVKGADNKTDLYGVIYRPPGFSPEKRYPVLDFSCAHQAYSYIPHGAFISGPFCGEPYLLGAAYAALGFVVIAIEVPGMPYRSKAFQDVSYNRLTSVNNFVDRIGGLHQLAKKYPYMDLNRVGLIGCDGITGPVNGLLEYPEFYKVGVMVAFESSQFEPASTVEMFGDLPYCQTENFYAEDQVDSLRGKLLLIHGMLDTVTPPAATFQLIQALQQANKDFDLLLLPNDGHEISSYALRRSWDYLVTYLQGIEPPKSFKLTTAWDHLMGAGTE